MKENKENNFGKLFLLDRIFFLFVFIIFLFDLPFLLKPVYKLFRKRLIQKFKDNEKLMEDLKKLEKTME